jgi:hypothetical protein
VDEVEQAAPFGHSVPRLTGWSGSPSMWMMLDCAFFAPSRPYIRMPQPTEQYGRCCAFRRARQLVLSDFRERLRRRKAQQGKTRSGKRRGRHLQELAPGHL